MSASAFKFDRTGIADRQFVYHFHWLGWSYIQLGFHVHFLSPNIEIHIPFGFFRIGWQGVDNSANRPIRRIGKYWVWRGVHGRP